MGCEDVRYPSGEKMLLNDDNHLKREWNVNTVKGIIAVKRKSLVSSVLMTTN
jgi:hypothetical protein